MSSHLTPPNTPPTPSKSRDSVAENLSPPSLPPTYGPRNPYDLRTEVGQAFSYCRHRIANPEPIDRWLQANLSSWPRSDPHCHSHLLVTQRLGPNSQSPSDPFTDLANLERYVLLLTLIFPDMSPYAPCLWDRQSPAAVVDRWIGSKDDIRSPDWCRSFDVGEAVLFDQPIGGMVDFFASLALSPLNRDEASQTPITRLNEYQ
ncbi:hypothetical protein HGRIS_001482 [Hohenbuehelia grisea]|uniref:Uncharacterized protein n=1 Tax=Hohenbuehelia grisea TaxID=104357 RepID=A0ABR3JPM1_9AGAR